MNYAYLRVSSDKQSIDNQKYEILKYCDKHNIKVDHWIEEKISTRKKLKERKLYDLLDRLNKEDVLIVAELSRLGRNLMEIMKLLHDCMEKKCMVHTIKENYQLGDNINSKVLAFAFGLSAEIERNLISQRTKEALARAKSEGKTLGRPKGSLSKHTKLTGKEEAIKQLLDKDISISGIARIMDVNRLTVKAFIDSRNIKKSTL